MYSSITKAVDLERWADELIARQKLPELVRKLIWATTTEAPQTLSFPADEGIQRRGWDGLLKVTQGNAWVAADDSCWELSTGESPEGKANENFQKRTEATPADVAARTAFVFVTPRKWERRATWVAERKKEGLWRDVRVLDSDDLEHWLERAPAVDAWVALLMGKVPAGVRSLSDRWSGIVALTKPALTPEVFTQGRAKVGKALVEALRGPASDVAVSALSMAEVLDFAAAALASGAGDEQVASRTLIVDSLEAWRQLAASNSLCVLLPSEGLTVDARDIAQAVGKGHWVVSWRPYTNRANEDELTLSRAWQSDVEQALVKAGFDEGRAARLARECGGSLTALQRLATVGAAPWWPSWTREDAAVGLLPLVLLGSWDDRKEADRAVVERVSGKPYAETADLAARWLNAVEPPLRRSGTIWTFVSRTDVWVHLAPRFSRPLLERFREAVVAVLGEGDPRFDMAPGNRMFAGINNVVPVHSDSLREGVAEALALLGAEVGDLRAMRTDTGTSLAHSLIGRLLGEEAPRDRWFSLAPLLPLLAEAAPEVFLSCLERDLAEGDARVDALFVGGGEGFFSSSRHHYLMWALEILAWPPDYLARVVRSLLLLRARDPGGNCSPRPGTLLRGIFRFWFPQTGANAKERFEILDLVAEEQPEQGWDLLFGLLSQSHDVASPAQQPRWRQWPGTKTPELDVHVVLEQGRWASERLVARARTREDWMLNLVGQCAELESNCFEELMAHLLNMGPEAFSAETAAKIWRKVHAMVRDQDYFDEREDRIGTRYLDQLRAVAERYTPVDTVTHLRWLFDESFLFVGRMGMEHEEQTALLLRMRAEALRELLKVEGLEGVRRLAMKAGNAWSVGGALWRGDVWREWRSILPSWLTDPDANVRMAARAYQLGAFDSLGWDWLKELELPAWSSEAVVELLRLLPCERRVWDLALAHGAETEMGYWSQVTPWSRDLGDVEIDEVLVRLLELDRVLPAADFAADAIHRQRVPRSERLIEILEKSLDALVRAADAGQKGQLDVHHVIEVLQAAQEAPDADEERLAGLEWHYLALLRHRNMKPAVLLRRLNRDPKLFVECIEAGYKARGEAKKAAGEEAEKDETKVVMANLAHELLRSWQIPPGTMPDGTLDVSKLRQWIEDARRLCAEVDRAEVGDFHIGRVLGHPRAEENGEWPRVDVRNVLERLPGDRVLSGFRNAIINGRGIHSRGHRAGGQQERDLAAKYVGYAEVCRLRWPRVAAALRGVAEFYTGEARRMDDETEAVG